MTTRIGHPCWYLSASLAAGGKWQRGTLHGWGVDYEEFDNGAVAFSVGIVEDLDTKHCDTIPVHRICFAKDSPDAETG
jgi:hypothetical protein